MPIEKNLVKKYGAMKNKKVKLMKNEQLYRVYDDEDKENRVLYFVTNEGRVISVTKKNGVEKVLKPVLSGGNYVVNIHGKLIRVQRLIYETINGQVPQSMVIIHRNKVKTDNAIVNLKAVPVEEAYKRMQSASVKANRKEVYCYDTGEYYCSAREAAEKLHVHPSMISHICNGLIKGDHIVNVVWADKKRGKPKKYE